MTWETVRVFLSSTFRDMHAERDHLVKVVFPEIRGRLEKHRIHLVDIDLRWGLTREQAENDRILDLCLQQVDECRPFFIGILGQRYGWVPDALLRAEHHDWIQSETGKSITALEIFHGVLRNPEMKGHAAFYLRKDAFLKDVPEPVRTQVFLDAHPEKLLALKEEIRRYCQASGAPLREYICAWNPDMPGYEEGDAGRIRGLEQFGAWVRDDLMTALAREHPHLREKPKAEAAPGSDAWLAEEQDHHEHFIESRLRAYVGRDEIHQTLLAHLRSADSGPPLLVTGPSGSGKSSVLARLYRHLEEGEPGATLLPHFVGAGPNTGSIRTTLRRFCLEMRRAFGFYMEVPEEMTGLTTVFRNFLVQVPEEARLMLVLDGLNQFDEADGAHALTWLPESLPGNAKIVLSCVDDAKEETQILENVRALGLHEVVLAPLRHADCRKIIERVPAISAKSLDAAQKAALLDNSSSVNPLFLRVALEELRGFGSFERLTDRIHAFPSPGVSCTSLEKAGFSPDVMAHAQGSAVTALFMQVIERLAHDFDPETVRRLLCLLAASRNGLREEELAAMISDLPGREDLFPILLQYRPYLMMRGELTGFFHAGLLHAVHARYFRDPGQEEKAHLELAAYFESAGQSPRRMDEWPWQLAQAKDWQELYACLTDPVFLKALYAHAPFEVKAFWAQIESNSDLRMEDAYQPVLDAPGEYLDSLSVVASLFDTAGLLEQALSLHAYASEQFRKAGDAKKLGTSLNNQANIHYQRSELEQALRLTQESESISRKAGHALALSDSLNIQALMLKSKGALDRARELLEEQERICVELGNQESVALSLGNQALVRLDAGDLCAAMNLLMKQERICKELGDKSRLSDSISNQALVQQAWGRLDRAMELLKETEELCRELGNKAGVAMSLANQSNVLKAQGDLDGAMKLLMETEGVFKELRDLDSLALCLGNQAHVLSFQGNLTRSLELLKKQERICRDLGNANGIALSIGNQALVLKSQGDVEGAFSRIQEQEKICREFGFRDRLADALLNRAVILQELKGDLDGALNLLREQEQIVREMGDQRRLAGSLGTQALVLHDKGDGEGALALHQEQEQICREVGDMPGLAFALGPQAVILRERGDLDGAMGLHGEEVKICRETGDIRGLACSLYSQGMVSEQRNDLQGALKLIEEALSMASQYGLMEQAAKMEPDCVRIRNLLDTSQNDADRPD